MNPGAAISARTARWLAWAMFVLSLALTALGLLLLILSLSHPVVHIYDHWLEDTLFGVGFSTIGAVIISRGDPENPMGWLFCATGFFWAVSHFVAQYAIYTLLAAPGSLPAGEAAAWIYSWLWVPNLGFLVLLLLLFPDGRLPARGWRWFAWLGVVLVLAGTVLGAFSPGPVSVGLGPINNPLGIEGLPSVYGLVQALMLALMFVALASLFVRLYRARGEERQQVKWFAYAFALAVGGAIFTYTLSEVTGERWLEWAGFIVMTVGVLGVPVAMGIAIMRYRLYDIDIIINRTLVYATLTVSVVALYVLLVGGIGSLLQTRGNLAISLLATGIVALLFQPLRHRLQRGVNRLMYGERDEPYTVLSRLGQRLEIAIAPGAVLAAIVETVAQALKLPYAAIALERGGGFEIAAAHGSPTGDSTVLPLIYQRETIGQLIVAPRAPGEPFNPADSRLLENVARHAELAVHAVRLTADLQHSRERLVTAREEERRRLRRDLHDGLGPTLAGLTFGLDGARRLLAQSPKDADALLTQLKDQTQEVVSDIRRLVYGLRPPALDDLGLIPAIREQAANHCPPANEAGRETGREDGSVCSVEAPEQLPPLPAAVEVAAYRISQEALTNVARHARGRACHVRLSLDDENALELEIVDDGVGIPEERRAGVGMTSMRERAAELGGTCTVTPAPTGGTRVLARLPLPARVE